MTSDLDPKLIADLLAMVAHDLRNPLSALGSNVAFIGSLLDAADADAQEALRDSLVSCEGLLHIIDNIDLLSYVLLGDRTLARAPLVLSPLVTEVVKKAKAMAASHGVELELEIEPGAAKAQAVAHRDMLGRVLSNVVRNAIQHGAGQTPVRVCLAVDGEDAVISVVDPGPPLAPELGDQAFTASGQLVAKGLAAGRYSRGLGLYAARIAADATGARLGAGAASDGRSEIKVSLPLSR